MSLGQTSPDAALRTALDNAITAGVTIVAAAGNCGDSSWALQGCDYQGQMVYPGNYSEIIAVGATDINQNRASFSSWGANLDVVAPGYATGSGSDVIRSPFWSQGNQTTSYTLSAAGTSIATPIVAGLVSLMKTNTPSLTPAQIETILRNSASKVTGMGGEFRTDYYGTGRINAPAALNSTHWQPDYLAGSANSVQPMVPILRSDGKVELFGVNSKAPGGIVNVYHIQQSLTSSWTGQPWLSLVGSMSSVSGVAYANSDMELFGVKAGVADTQPNAYHMKYDHLVGWDADWSVLPSTRVTAITPLLRSDGKVELFGVNTKAPTNATNVYHIVQNGSGAWSGQSWTPLFGYVTSISGVAYANGNLELFSTNTFTPNYIPNSLKLKYTNGVGWDADWSLLPNSWFTVIAPILRSDGFVELFGANTKAPTNITNIYHMEQNGSGGYAGQQWLTMWGYLTAISGVGYTNHGIELFGSNTLTPTYIPNALHLQYQLPGGWDPDWSLLPNAWLG
jgi:hypothetical protein